MKPREREVRQYAAEILDQLGIDRPPIDPARIAELKGLSLLEAEFPPQVYGALAKVGNRFQILVSPLCPTPGHRSFTIAHELGHYHIDGHLEVLFATGNEIAPSLGGHFRDYENREEREADWFASELLAPKHLVQPRILELPASIDSLTTLADKFATSLMMMALRYAELTDKAVATVLSHQERIEWVIPSERIREHQWSYSLRRRDFVPRSTATRGLGADRGAVARAEMRTGSNLLCEWFEKAPEEIKVEEDAIGLGTFGRVLTFLIVPGLPDAEELAEMEYEEQHRERDWRDALRGYELG